MFKKNEAGKQTDRLDRKAPKSGTADDPGFNRSNRAQSFAEATSQSAAPKPSQPNRAGDSGQGPRAVIGASVIIKGEVHANEDVSIYGKVDGAVVLPDNHLLIGNSGKIDANVKVKSIDVEGSLKGEVAATERITIRKSGTVNGNINAPRVMLEDGCRFEGNIQMSDDRVATKTPPVAKPEKSAAK